MKINYPVELQGTSKVKMWADPNATESVALDQLRTIDKLPWVSKVAVMPDVHYGKGATVGSVIAMRDAVAPSAVGVDIGCGMVFAYTSLTLDELPDDLSKVRASIEATVPVGFAGHEHSANIEHTDASLKARIDAMNRSFSDLRADKIADRHDRAIQQCGTLGGGNHFIELVHDENGRVGVMLHSGSRNIGKELAERHIAVAKGLEHNLELPDRDLAVFLNNTPQMQNYLHDLYWAQDYALLNRDIMMALVEKSLRKHFPKADFGLDTIKCHHNYVSEETYDGEDLIVTRKGAISAQRDQMGLIPGSMGTGSYIVKGLGNTEGLCSASHGAGRKMSRGAAKRQFTIKDLASQTKGVECRKDQGVLDEIPGAYKNLEQVIAIESEGSSPLVEVVARLRTLLCVKG